VQNSFCRVARDGRVREGVAGGKKGARKGGEITQTLYADMNKIKINKRKKLTEL
jgi:hypothetical protein